VPDLVGLKVNDAEGIWAAAGFTGALIHTRTGNYTVASQSLGAGTSQPCTSTITASDT
jgi:hypothetical protein